MGLNFVGELTRQVRSIKHSYFAADDRRDLCGTARIGLEWTAAEDAERAAVPTTDAGARLKLMTAARDACRSGDDALKSAIVRIARSARGPLSLEGLIALRALLPLAQSDDRIAVPLQFAASWWGRPRSV